MKKSIRSLKKAVRRFGDRFGGRRASQRTKLMKSRRPQMEPLEQRQMLSITVDSPLDVVGNDGVITLREALVAANTNQAYYDAPAGSAVETDVIDFDSGVFDGTVGITFGIGNGQLEITDDLDIEGPGAGLLTIDANEQSRVFHVASGVTASISDLTITGGKELVTGENGGGIYNAGSLLLTGMVLTGNEAEYYGGGIYSATDSTLTVSDSIISVNEAGYGGGAAGYDCSFTIIDSTIENNTAAIVAGGVVGHYGSLSIERSSILGNIADVLGGGIAVNTLTAF